MILPSTAAMHRQVALAVLGMFLCAGSAWSEPAWISIAAAEYRFIDNGQIKTLPIPLSVETGTEARLQLAVVGVRLNNANLPEVIQAFGATLDTHAQGARFIDLTVDPRIASRAGTYEVWVAASATGKPTEILKISVEHTAAVLRPVEPQPVEIVYGMRADRAEATSLRLELTSEQSRITDVVMGAMRFSATTVPVTGSIALDREIGAISSETPIERRWRVTGRFPLGVTQVKTEIRAPQLAAPVPVTLNIKARRGLTFLWLATIAGLLVGWILKNWLEGYLQLRRARLEALKTIERVTAFLQLHPDPLLDDVRRQAEEFVVVAQHANDAAKLAAATGEMQQKAKDAFAKLDDSRAALRVELNRWLHTLGVERDLPPALKTTVHDAATLVRDIVPLLKQAPSEVQSRLMNATWDIAQAVTQWKSEMLALLTDYADPGQLLLPANVAQQVGPVASDIREALGALSASPADAAGGETILNMVMDLRLQVSLRLVAFAVRKLTSTADTVAGAWPAGDDRLLQVVASAAIELRSASAESALGAMRTGASTAVQGMDAAYRAFFERAPVADENRERLRVLVAARDYVAASQLLVAQPKRAASPVVSPQFAAGVAFVRDVPDRASTTGAQLQVVETISLEPLQGAIQVALSTIRTRKQIWFAQFLQSGVTGVLFILIAHVTYADKFIGTAAELIGVFLWAFSVDVTVAKLLDAAKGVPAQNGK